MQSKADTHEFHTYSATALAEGLRSKKWSSETLTRYFLKRIEKANPDLHAVHFLNPRAIQQAQAIDKKRAQGEDIPPLAGLPMTLKDAVADSEQRSTYGALPYKYHRPKKDAQCVVSLKKAGFVFLGRTAVPTASFDWNCRNQIFPECVNPINADYSPGGSSGGAAAALKAGLTPIELGSDLGGSIRYPAHCCGIYGIRLSEGWVPFEDVGPNGKGSFKHIGTCGPMANNLEDLGLILDIFAQDFPDSRLKKSKPNNKPLRIAFSYDVAGTPSDDATRVALNKHIDQLRQTGAEITEIKPDLDFRALNALLAEVIGYQYKTMFSEKIPAKLKAWALDTILFQKVGDGVMRDGVLKGMRSKEQQFLKAMAQVRSVEQTIDRFFKDFDLWILPTSPSVTRLRSESGTLMQTHLGEVSYSDFVGSYICGTSLLGTPAIALPIGENKGLPIGVQIHGPRFSDLVMLEQIKGLHL